MIYCHQRANAMVQPPPVLVCFDAAHRPDQRWRAPGTYAHTCPGCGQTIRWTVGGTEVRRGD